MRDWLQYSGRDFARRKGCSRSPTEFRLSLLHHLKENPQIRHTVFSVRREKISSDNYSTGDFIRHYDAMEEIRLLLHLEVSAGVMKVPDRQSYTR